MSDLIIYGHYKRPKKKPEINSGEIIVEKAGYIPAKQQIMNLINAGKRLLDYRREQYDFSDPKEVDNEFEDPTRKGSFDLADASQITRSIEERAAMEKINKDAAAAAAADTVEGSKEDPETVKE